MGSRWAKIKWEGKIQMKLEEIKSGNWYSSVSVVTRFWCVRQTNHGSISGMEKIFFFSLHLIVQTGCDAHPGSCSVGVVGSACVELCCHYTMYFNGRVLRNSMEKSLPWEWTVCQLCEKIPPIFWGTQTFINVFTPALPLVPVTSQINRGHARSYFCNIDINITIPSTARSSKWSLSYWLSHQDILCPLFCPVVPY